MEYQACGIKYLAVQLHIHGERAVPGHVLTTSLFCPSCKIYVVYVFLFAYVRIVKIFHPSTQQGEYWRERPSLWGAFRRDGGA